MPSSSIISSERSRSFAFIEFFFALGSSFFVIQKKFSFQNLLTLNPEVSKGNAIIAISISPEDIFLKRTSVWASTMFNFKFGKSSFILGRSTGNRKGPIVGIIPSEIELDNGSELSSLNLLMLSTSFLMF